MRCLHRSRSDIPCRSEPTAVPAAAAPARRRAALAPYRLEQLEPRCEPFFTCRGHVLRHGRLLILDGEVRLVKNLTDLNHVAFVGGAPLRPSRALLLSWPPLSNNRPALLSTR